ncbi:hypothetical protein CV102_10485 [Natronococcus pandeyae]|uniref:Halobacterial output domain-containing protein n=2 Tax=Natronococcus pandeyae TaxID=2055836 RepID=A0A8J8Q3Y1_9EURY|nr:hypothetical protein CV102_10485 [Natronococcus pandeyae]
MPVSQRVVRAVAIEIDADPLEMEPLYDVIDSEALNALFEPTKRDATRSTGTVAFRYAGCAVTVHADGGVEVTAERASRPASQTDSNAVN